VRPRLSCQMEKASMDWRKAGGIRVDDDMPGKEGGDDGVFSGDGGGDDGSVAMFEGDGGDGDGGDGGEEEEEDGESSLEPADENGLNFHAVVADGTRKELGRLDSEDLGMTLTRKRKFIWENSQNAQ
jgi:hypothetical protein